MTGPDSRRRPAGSLESEVMAALQHAAQPLTPAQVQDRLTADLAYTTVVTILTRMHAKGLAARSKEGRSFRYRPVDDETGLAARRMHQVLEGEPDRESILARFVDTLSEGDERLLRRLLDRQDPG
ncbi:BlaI/MecI/CopY family transcriptional regulator [Acrocarpospora catenulata]|uniref:BlaI/MecI/CopY family transcriptional regulator n=1 Tax=Acrocarpospora catenulata TaxID=2836182 RepID=UPI001BD96158|nr:BlaI/MecI/CopY family transcriptional regulator [Acrocarpospora catenulata]